MKKYLLWSCMVGAMLTLGLLGAHVATAQGPPTTPPGNSGSNPGSPGDDCSHGNSNQPCKPDPQPGHGAECDDHGNASGNEDHCDATTTSSTTSTTTSTTETTSTSGTTTTTEQGTTSSSGGTTTTETAVPLGTSTTTPSGSLQPPASTDPKPDPAPPLQKNSGKPGSLPFTGLKEDLAVFFGSLMLLSGLALRKFSS